jgi:transposase
MFDYFAGIDMSKDSFSFSVIDKNEKEMTSGKYDVNQAGFKKFLNVLEQFPNIATAVESTGSYHITLMAALIGSGFATYLITPLLVKNFSKSYSLRTIKTDKIDARLIAVFANRNNGTLRPVKSVASVGLREIARLKETISDELGTAKRKLKRLMVMTFPELVKAVNIFSDAMIALIEKYPSAEAFRNASGKEIDSIFNAVKKGRKLSYDVDFIKSLAGKSVGISGYIEASVKHQIRMIKTLSEELKEASDKLVEITRQNCNEEIEVLTSIPGIGENTASHFIAEIGSIDKFQTVRQLTAYAGTDPGPQQSGTMLRGGRISKKGNSSVRRIGYIMTFHLIQYCPVFTEYYAKKKAEGMPSMKAMIATLNKMLRMIFAMLKNKSHFLINYS